MRTQLTPRLAELITYCRARGIKGSYSVKPDPPHWRAKVTVGMVTYSGQAATEDEALDRMAGVALNALLDPQPVPGTPDYSAWQERRKR